MGVPHVGLRVRAGRRRHDVAMARQCEARASDAGTSHIPCGACSATPSRRTCWTTAGDSGKCGDAAATRPANQDSMQPGPRLQRRVRQPGRQEVLPTMPEDQSSRVVSQERRYRASLRWSRLNPSPGRSGISMTPSRGCGSGSVNSSASGLLMNIHSVRHSCGTAAATCNDAS